MVDASMQKQFHGGRKGQRMMCYPMGGTIDGQYGDHVLLAPPFIIDGSHVSDITDRLGEAVDAAIASVPD